MIIIHNITEKSVKAKNIIDNGIINFLINSNRYKKWHKIKGKEIKQMNVKDKILIFLTETSETYKPDSPN